MPDEVAGTEAADRQRGIDQTVSQAFFIAHLLTADAEQAERVVLEALESWDPAEESEEMLVERVLTAGILATSKSAAWRWNQPTSVGAHVQPEIQAVLRLPSQLRHSFVLRVLVGLSRQAAARLLQLSPRQVDQHTCAALKCLPALADRSIGGFEYLVWKWRMS